MRNYIDIICENGVYKEKDLINLLNYSSLVVSYKIEFVVIEDTFELIDTDLIGGIGKYVITIQDSRVGTIVLESQELHVVEMEYTTIEEHIKNMETSNIELYPLDLAV